MASGIELVANFAEQYRTQDDYLYLLVDGQAECALDHPLSVPSLIESLGADAVTRVLRPDLVHSPEYCPALVQLAKPGEAAARRYLELSADYAEWDLVYRKRYICGWLLSPRPLDVIANHIATRCDTTAGDDQDPSSWFEPLRLELLFAAMNTRAGELLSPVGFWLLPLSWGGFTPLAGRACYGEPELSPTARQSQQLAPVVNRFLAVWRHALRKPPRFAPWLWKGPTLLPPQAAIHGFRLIRDARRLGLEASSDLISLSLHRVFFHPNLPGHPDIQRDIAQARAGTLGLQSHFASYSEATWRRIVYDLPRAEDYT
ncbi:hypothetical protein [Pseudomonas sp. NyZ201]|uniref:hypothetical protein n=1 Tax=Pseudomonas sp. NyZ201 TaxID=3409857 RepID=UPI003CF88ECD